jgi:hypothetical protein
MKTKIIIVGNIALFAFTMSSFQNMGDDQDYHSITDKNLKWHEMNATQTAVGCAKCHDCQKDDLVLEDSTTVSTPNYLVLFKSANTISEKISPVIPNCNDTESPDNFKTN